MATLAILKSLHSLDNRQFIKGLSESERRSRKAGQKIGRSARRMRGQFQRLTSGVMSLQGAIGVLAGGAGIGLLVRSQMQAIQTTQRLTDISGVQARTIEAMKIQARDYGVSQERVNDAVVDFSERLGEARTGTGEAVDGFKLLEEASGRQLDLTKNVNAVWSDFVTAMGQVADESDRAAIAAQVGGDALRDMLPVLSDGAKGFEEAADQAERFGLAFNNIEAAQVRDANEAIADMQAAFEGVSRQLTIDLAPFIEAAAREITEMSQESIDFGSVFATVGGHAVEVVGWMADGFHAVRIGIKGAEVGLVGLGGVIIGIGEKIMRFMFAPLDAWVELVNATIRKVNAVAGTALQEIPTVSDALGARELEERSERAFEHAKSAAAELRQMLLEPMPSQQIRAFVMGIQQRMGELSAGLGGGDGDGEDGESGPGRSGPTGRNIDSYMESLARIREIEREHQMKLQKINAQGQSRLLSQQLNFLDMMEAADKSSGAAQVGIMTNAFAQITAQGAQHSKKMFKLNQAAGIANAIISTQVAAARALAEGGPFLGPVLAAAMVAAGMAKVQAIRSQSFSGGGGAAPSASAGGGVPAVQDVGGQGGQEQAGTRQNVTVQFMGSRTSARDARALLEELRDAAGDDATLGDITFQGA